MILVMGLLAFAQSANAACASPAGNTGDIRYASNYGVMAYCSGSGNWTSMAGGVSVTVNATGGGATPAGSSADVQFNSSGALAADTGNFTYATGLLKAPNLQTGNISTTTVTATGLGTFGTALVNGGMTVTGQASITTISSTLTQLISNTTTACTTALAGAQRYNGVSNTIDYCTGTAWMSMGPSSTQPISFRVDQASAQSVSDGTFTKITNLTNKYFDTNNNFASSRFTVTVPGKYLLTAQTAFDFSGAGAFFDTWLVIYKNGSTYATGARLDMASSSGSLYPTMSAIVDAQAGDYFEVYIYQHNANSASQSTIYARTGFAGVLLAPQGGGSGGGTATPAGSTGDIQFNTASALDADTGNLFWDKTNHRLGIGTNSPSDMVVISATTATSNNLLSLRNGFSTGYAQVAYYGDKRTYSAGVGNSGAPQGLANKFYVYDSVSGSARIVVDPNGNVGIANVTPTAALDVGGEVRVGNSGLACGSTVTGAMRYTSGTMQVCDGSNWTNVGIGIPQGTISAFAATSCPSGWSEYTAARGRFLRGIDNGAGVDPSGTRVAGDQQADALQNITGAFSAAGAVGFQAPSGVFYTAGALNPWPSAASGNLASGMYFDASRVVRTSTETRPKNVAVIFCQYQGYQSQLQTGVATLASLSDVSVAGATTGQVLTYSGGTWVASTTTGGASAAGAANDVQFKNGSGNLAADTGRFTYTSSTGTLSATTISTTALQATGLGTFGSLLVNGGMTATGVSSLTTVSSTLVQLISNATTACTAGLAGAQRYNGVSNTIDYCSGSAWLSLGPSSTQPVAFSATKGGTNQTITANSFLKMTWSTKELDTNNNFSACTTGCASGAQNATESRFTATVPGKYFFYASVNCPTATTCAVALFKNGSEIRESPVYASTNQVPNVSVITDMSVGDYIEVKGYSGDGSIGGTTRTSSFAGALLSPQGSGSGTATPAGSTNDVQYNSAGNLAADTGNFTYAGGLLKAPTVSATALNSQYASVTTLYNSGSFSGNTAALNSVSSTAVSASTISATMIQVGNNGASCGSAISGAMRYTSGTMQVCDGTAWTNVGIGIPQGAIAAFALTSCPSGWSEYTAARGRFLRGIDNGAGVDPDGTRAPGSLQAFQTKIGMLPDGSTINGNAEISAGGNTWRFDTLGGIGTVNSTASETRPVNVAVIFCQYQGFQSQLQTGVATLASLSDVSVAGANSGSALVYNGSSWIAGTATGNAQGDRITSSTFSIIANPTAYASLSTNGTTWGYLGNAASFLPQLQVTNLNAGNVSSTLVQTGASSATCSSGLYGTMRWNATSDTIQICNTAGWTSLSSSSVPNTTLSQGTANYGAIFSGPNTLVTDSALYIDRTNHRIGIGTAAPAVAFQVSASTASSNIASLINTDTTGRSSLVFQGSGGTSNLEIGFGNSASTYASLPFIGVTNAALPLTFWTNSAERMRISSAGNVGIGTTSPNVSLTVVGEVQVSNSAATCAANTNGGAIRYVSGTGIQYCNGANTWTSLGGGGGSPAGSTGDIQYNSGGSFAADTGNLFWDGTNHRLGVGTVTPTRPLEVSGTARIVGTGSQLNLDNTATSQQSLINFFSVGTNKWQIGKQLSGDQFFVYDVSGSRYVMLADPAGNMSLMPSGGNVGIGLSAPSTTLDISASSASFGIRSIASAALGASSGGGLLLMSSQTPTASGQRLGLVGIGAPDGAGTNVYNVGISGFSDGAWSSGVGPTYMIFETAGASGSRAERMRIDSSGRVGIGATAPTNTQFYATSDTTNATGTNFGSYLSYTQRVSSNGQYLSVGGGTSVQAIVNSGVSNTSGSIQGLNVNALRNNASDIGGLNSLYGITASYGHNTGTATARQTSSSIGLQINPYAQNGSQGTMFDILLSSLNTGGTVGTHYAIYQQDVNAANVFGGSSYFSNDIYLNNGTNNVIWYGTTGVAVPGAGSNGQKIQLYGTAGSVGASDYSLGVQSGNMWFNSGGGYYWYTSGASKMILDSSGNLTAAAFLYSSDKRLKSDITPLTAGLSKLDSLNPVSFRFTADPSKTIHLGLIAQDVQKVYPEAVKTNDKGFLALDYPSLIGPMVDMLKEMKTLVLGDHDEIARLKAANDNLAKNVSSLKAESEKLKSENALLKASNDNVIHRLDAIEKRVPVSR